MMDYIVGKGFTLDRIADGVFTTIDEKDERRAIVNKITDGMLDKYEALQPRVNELETEMEDCANRKRGIEAKMAAENREISKLEKKLANLMEKLAQPDPEPPAPPKISADEKKKKIEQAIKELLEEWAEKLAAS